MPPKIVLASGSPRRYELLHRLGIPFEVRTSHVSEEIDSSIDPNDIVTQLSLRKAMAIAPHFSHALIIGADTIVYYDGAIIGKPHDRNHAIELLRCLQGHDHDVYSGIALIEVRNGKIVKRSSQSRKTKVWLRPLSHEMIEWYVNSGESLDKAGAYGIQGLGACLITSIEGCYFNVVGLSLSLLCQMMDQYGYPIDTFYDSSHPIRK